MSCTKNRSTHQSMFRSPLPLPYILLSCWAHLPSPQVLLGLAQYRRADETTVIRNGMVRYATTLLYTVLLLLIVHTFLLTGRFGIDLNPIWTHGTFPPGRARVASDISLRLGIIRSWGASHPARTHRSMHATPCFSLRSVSEWHWPFIEVTPGQAQ